MRRASSASQNEAGTLDSLSFQLVELRLSLESLERERDFYFGKLADIEQVVSRDGQDNKIRQAVREILYQAEVSGGRTVAGEISLIAGLKSPVRFRSSVRSKAKVRMKVRRRQPAGAVLCPGFANKSELQTVGKN